jgi:hypothetical protein
MSCDAILQDHGLLQKSQRSTGTASHEVKGPCSQQDSIRISKIACPASQGRMEGESQAGASTISPGRAFHEEKETLKEGVLPEPGKPPLGSVCLPIKSGPWTL